MLMASLVLSERPSNMVIAGTVIVLTSVLALNLEPSKAAVPAEDA
jgi:drug/metabolite transporter (DMT)-like permease